MLGSLHLYQLLVLLAVLVAPVVFSACYGPICGASRAYYSKSTNTTIIPVLTNVKAEKICVHPQLLESVCSDSRSDWAVLYPGKIDSMTLCRVYIFDGMDWEERTARYVFKELESVPETFSLAWVHADTDSFGSLSEGRLFLRYQANSVVKANNETIALKIADAGTLMLPCEGDFIDSEDQAIEPGSWFMSLASIASSGQASSSVVALSNDIYIEFVMSKSDIQKNRRFAIHNSNDLSSNLVRAEAVSAAGGAENLDTTTLIKSILSKGRRPRKERDVSLTSVDTDMVFSYKNDANLTDSIHVCIWGSDKLDGQKSIWIQQVHHMNQIELKINVKYRFTWMLTSVPTENGVKKILLNLPNPPQIVKSPFEEVSVFVETFDQIPDNGGPPMSQFWDGTQESIVQYIVDRFAETPNRKFSELSPAWVREYMVESSKLASGLRCDLMVYGSNRGFSNDALIVLLARELGIPSASELLNLFADAANVPNAIIGPSHYAIYHESIEALHDLTSKVLLEVVPPGVDLKRFDINLRSDSNSRKWKHPKCQDHVASCIVIGFMARVTVEKNPGLFVMAAHQIRQVLESARFVMIGDGGLMEHIKELVDILQMSDLFYFPGWLVGEDLPNTLAGIDIMVNPSLRAWSETFCIANLESMAMGIPLVTFAVGGIGEYVSPPDRCHRVKGNSQKHLSSLLSTEWESFTCMDPSTEFDDIPDYEVVKNAVILNKADPTVIAQAALFLLRNPAEMKRIVLAALDTVVNHFSSERQVLQYSILYKNLRSRYNKYITAH